MNEELGKLKYPADSLDRCVVEFKKELVRLQGLLDVQTGKVREPKPYPIDAVTNLHINDAGRPEYSRYGSEVPQPSIALARAAKAYEESKPLVAENQAICDENRRIVTALIQSIENAGIPGRVEVVVSGPRAMRTKREMQEAPWKSLGGRVRQTDYWPESERRYKEFLARVAKWQEEIDAKKKAEEREQAKKRETIEAESRRITLCLKYGADPVKTSLYDLREMLLRKNKYLHLAYFLEKNRGDWNDGPSYAEAGLNGFTIETPDDQLIYDDINGSIEDWQGDGRVFRDCTWNYGRIYAEFVPAELRADFEALGPDND